MTVLSQGEIEQQLRSLDGWTVQDGAIRKQFTFAGFPEAVAFVQRLVPDAEEAEAKTRKTETQRNLAPKVGQKPIQDRKKQDPKQKKPGSKPVTPGAKPATPPKPGAKPIAPQGKQNGTDRTDKPADTNGSGGNGNGNGSVPNTAFIDPKAKRGRKPVHHLRFLIFKDSSQVNDNPVIFNTHYYGRAAGAAPKALFQVGNGMLFAANMKDRGPKSLRWRRTASGKRFALDKLDFHSSRRQIGL